MIDFLLTLIGYAFVAALWLCIFLAGRVAVRHVRVRRYDQAAAFSALVLVLLWVDFSMGLYPGASAYARYRNSGEMFGRKCALPAPRLSYDSPRFFNGDGYSIDVIDLPDSLARWVTSPPAGFLEAYPVRSSYRSQWKAVTWHRTPLGAEDRKFLEFALMESANNEDLRRAKQLLEQLADEPGHYIAYFHRMLDGRVTNLDFFLLSPSKRVFIRVNSNT